MKLERWQTNLYTLWVTQIFSMVGFGLGVPFIPYYLQTMGVSDPNQLSFLVGLSSTLPAATMALVSPLWGKLSDLYGRKMMLMRAMAGATIILAGYGFCRSVVLFMVLRALHGIFTGTCSAAMTFVSANTPSEKMSYALGFMTSSNFLGYAIGPVMGGFLVEIIGYSNCFFTGAVVMTIGCMLVMFLVKEDPSSYGRERLKNISTANTGEVAVEKPTRLITRAVIIALAVIFLVRITRNIFSPFVSLFVQDRLGSMEGAATYTGFINGACCIGTALAAVTIARMGDRYNKYNLVKTLAFLAMGVSLLLLPRFPLVTFCGFYALYFFVCGAIEPVLTSLISSKTDARNRGTLFGIIGTLNSIAMMTAPMLGTGISITFTNSAILWSIPALSFLQVVALILGKNQLYHEGFELNKETDNHKEGDKKMKIDFNKTSEYTASCKTGEIKIKKLPITDVKEAEELYSKLLITKENYREKLGMVDYDSFYSFGGKYQPITADEFGRMVVDDNWTILGAYYENKLVGAIWASVSKGFFVNMGEFNFKKEYGGVGRIWERHLEGAGIANDLETFCEAPENFPSVLAVLHYMLVQHYMSNGVEATVSQIYKNISCRSKDEERNLDTFNYSSYNAYKMLGYEHVGNLPLKDIPVADGSIIVTVEPQLIAGLDLYLQNMVITKILESEEITIK